MAIINFDPNLIPIHDQAKNVFEVLYQMHPELKASSIDWYKVTAGNHSSDIRVAVELYIPKIIQGQFVIAKQEERSEPVVICPNGKILKFANTNQQTSDGKKFKLLLLTTGKSVNPDDSSKINIFPDENTAEKDFAAIYYIPPQTTKNDASVEEVIYIYNFAAEEILYRHLYGKKRVIVPILFQVASFWRSQNNAVVENKDENNHSYPEETNKTPAGYAIQNNNSSFIENQLSSLINHLQSQNSSSISNSQMLSRIQGLESQLLIKQTEDKYQHYITEQSRQIDKLLELSKQLIETTNQSLKNIHSSQPQPAITNTITTPPAETSHLHDIKKELENVLESLKEKSAMEEKKDIPDKIKNELISRHDKNRTSTSIN